MDKRNPLTWLDKAFIIAIYTFIIWALFFLPAKADESWVLTLDICNTNHCQEKVIPLPEGTTMMDCVKQGQVVAQKWLADNKPPGWVLHKYRCGPRRSDV